MALNMRRIHLHLLHCIAFGNWHGWLRLPEWWDLFRPGSFVIVFRVTGFVEEREHPGRRSFE